MANDRFDEIAANWQDTLTSEEKLNPHKLAAFLRRALSTPDAEFIGEHPTSSGQMLLGRVTGENRRLTDANEKLATEVERLKDAMRRHKHTDECFLYAKKTSRASGQAYCIAKCSDSWKAALRQEGGE